jgi:hypothetical protein
VNDAHQINYIHLGFGDTPEEALLNPIITTDNDFKYSLNVDYPINLAPYLYHFPL